MRTISRVVLLLAASLLVLPVFANENKHDGSLACRAYFTMFETDETTAGIEMVGLDGPQYSWYKKHGQRGKFAGICYWDLSGSGKRLATAALPDNLLLPPSSLPFYSIRWGERLVTQPYTNSYETSEQKQVKVTDDSGNTSTGTVDVPVTHVNSGTQSWYVADGQLRRWDRQANTFYAVWPLHNHNRTGLTSASTSLLKDGLEAIRKAENEGHLSPPVGAISTDLQRKNGPEERESAVVVDRATKYSSKSTITTSTESQRQQNAGSESSLPAQSGRDGTLSITSAPSGAEIFIDSVGRGQTPVLVKVAAGEHSVQVVKKGYKDWVQQVSVDSGSITNVTADLKP